MKQNHFAKRKPTVVLYQPDENEEPVVLTNDKGEVMIFPNFFKAKAFVDEFADAGQIPHLHYVNHKPAPNAGDMERTGGKKCLKCGTPVVPSNVVERQRLGGSDGQVVQIEQYLCPVCDA